MNTPTDNEDYGLTPEELTGFYQFIQEHEYIGSVHQDIISDDDDEYGQEFDLDIEDALQAYKNYLRECELEEQDTLENNEDQDVLEADEQDILETEIHEGEDGYANE